MIKNILLIFLCCFQHSIFAQQVYSKKALTGKGGLELVGEKHKLQAEVYKAFNQMKEAALKEGIQINLVSAYRSFKRQKLIWNRKYTLYIKQGYSPKATISKIVEYSTIPGTSRHHWGTDIDIIEGGKKHTKNVLNENNFVNKGAYSNLKVWMDANANKFGFYLVYTNNSTRKGFKYEPWHYTYRSISKPMLKQFLKININEMLKYNHLKGEKYLTPDFVKKYLNQNILDINKKLF